MNGDAQLRVLMRTSTARDAVMAQAVLARADIETQVCGSLHDLVREVGQGAGAVLVSEEMLAGDGASELSDAVSSQPPWSDLPVLVLARQGADSRAISIAMEGMANVTVLERPIRVAALVSALRSALSARRRQYELRRILADLNEADKRKTEFLATLAHELRNPMAPLGTALAILTRKTLTHEAALPYYQLMGRQIDHMVRLVNDLMEVSRITRGKIDLQLGELALDLVIRDAVELSRPLMDAGKHTLQVHAPPLPLTIDGDGVRLTQVFSNLLNNAAKYTPESGRVDVFIEHAGPNAVVRVRDNGTGIAPAMLGSIFDMFVQVSGTARAAQGGLGIGLTLVRSLVELHGGTVVAKSEGLGRGSEFTVSLPLSRKHRHRDDATAPASDEDLLALQRILVVDDNRDAAESLAALLGVMGAVTELAFGGQEALEKAAAFGPTLAILDIGMPGMDGCEVAQILRADPRHRAIGLVALTGWGQPGDRARVAQAGFDHHLLKPVDVDALSATLLRLAAKSRG